MCSVDNLTEEEPCEGQEVCSNKTADSLDGVKERKERLAKRDSAQQLLCMAWWARDGVLPGAVSYVSIPNDLIANPTHPKEISHRGLG